MTTIIYIFFIALLTSFFLTPLVRKLALRYNIVDTPSSRKIHTQPIARIGGVALFLSFVTSFALLYFNTTMFESLVVPDKRFVVFAGGALAVFILGLWDDFKPLSPYVKFIGQIIISIAVFAGGIQIQIISVPLAESVDLGFLSLPVTVFWFVLVINAINLIDGLDGLAAGVCLFVSMTMLVICLTNGRIIETFAFAALGGALIGFLRYNFSPASIFMGDSGSYFLGYTIAALSVMGSIKGQVATAMLIPIIALGIPLIDALWAPARRFALGKKVFQPDTGHLHHTLVNLGYTHRRAVLIIYGATILLGTAAIVLVHSKDEIAALVLLVLGAGSIFLVNFLNTRERTGAFGISRWIYEVSDASGFTHERRSFFNHQVLVSQAQDVQSIWTAVCDALQSLEIDEAELSLNGGLFPMEVLPDALRPGRGTDRDRAEIRLRWEHSRPQMAHDNAPDSVLRIELPLLKNDGDSTQHYGMLFLVKDVEKHPLGRFILSRVEHLRGSIIIALARIAEDA